MSVPSPERTSVYTDGACRGNPGPGGWAWAVPEGPYASGASPNTTNQRMEIEAALEAVQAIAGPVEVVSDSTYVVNCFRDRWYEGWQRRNWTNSQRKPVANDDLWRPLIAAYLDEPGRITFRWVKGHGSDPYNDLVDRLAVEAATTQSGRSGSGPPENLPNSEALSRAARKAARQPEAPAQAAPAGDGAAQAAPAQAAPTGDHAAQAAPAGDPAARARAALAGDPALARAQATAGAPGPAARRASASSGHQPPLGHRVVVTGLRPPGLGGYDENAIASGTRAKLAEILTAQAQLHPDLVVLTGLGLGAETLAAEAAAGAGLPFVAVLPYPDVDRLWPAGTRRHFNELLGDARDVLTLQADPPPSKQRAGVALARRDAWLARHAAQAIIVWDGKDGTVERTLQSFRDHIGDDVWLLEPARG